MRDMSDRFWTALVSLLVIIGYLAFGYLLLTGIIKPNVSGDVALTLTGGVFGVMTAAFIIALSFWLGSSVGSRSKDGLIAGQLPPPPATPVPSPPVSVPPPTPLPIPPLPKPPPEPPPGPVPGNVMTFTGKMSHFGGPNDMGVAPDEGLALCEPEEMGKFPGMFLPVQPPGTTGLARRLDPTKLYVACRWNYKRTPRGWLQGNKARASANGRTLEAQPIDWGPNENTGRVADLSPGLEVALGLTTDGVVTIEMPLPPGSPPIDPVVGGGHLKVLTSAQLDAAFGPFPYTEGPHGTVIPDPAWVAANIVTVEIPQLSKLVKGGKVECNKAVAEPLKTAFAEMESSGVLGDILTWDGLWVPRHIGSDPSRGISRHSRGLACDINAEWNPYGGREAQPSATGSNYRIADVMQRHGFAWGAWFGRSSLSAPPASDTDGMHFEFVGIPPTTT